MSKMILIQYGINLTYAYEELKQGLIDKGFKIQFDRIEIHHKYPINDHVKLPFDLVTVNQLPIILLLIKNYKMGNDIFYNIENDFHALNTNLFYDFKKIRKTRANVESQLKALNQYDIYGHYFTERSLLSGVISLIWIKKNLPKAINITGGPFLDFVPTFCDILLDSGLLDSHVRGDGHESLRQIIDLFNNSKAIPRLMDNQIKNLNDFPRPISILPNVFNYNKPTAYLYGSRGCFGRCTYCPEKRPLRVIDFNILMNWIDEIVKQNVYKLSFVDVTFNHSKSFIKKLFKALLERDLVGKISIDFAFVRVDLMDKEIIEIFKQLKVHLSIGVESFARNVITSMKKDFDYDHMIDILDLLRENKIPFVLGRIFCYPGETMEEFHHSRKMFIKYGYTEASNFMLIPNTELHLHPEKYNLEVINFPESVSNIIPEYKSNASSIPMTYVDKNDPHALIYNKKLKIIKAYNFYFEKKLC